MVVRPERRTDFLAALQGMLEPVRVERGCLKYRLYEDRENSNVFVLLEEWETQEDLERHILKDNQQRLLSLMDLLSERPEFRFVTVSQAAGMDLIENILTMNEYGIMSRKDDA